MLKKVPSIVHILDSNPSGAIVILSTQVSKRTEISHCTQPLPHDAIQPSASSKGIQSAQEVASELLTDNNRVVRNKKHFGGDFCCVPGCTNQRGKDKYNGVKRSYYSFPKDANECARWVRQIRRSDWIPRSWDRVCSDHFIGGKKTSLGTEGSVPALFPLLAKCASKNKKTTNESSLLKTVMRLGEVVSKLRSYMYQLQEKKLLCDVTLTAADGKVEAHSVVLAAASSFLCSSFLSLAGEGLSGSKFNIDLTGFSRVDICTALRFLYIGQMPVTGSSDFEVHDRYQRVVQIFESLGIEESLVDNNEVIVHKPTDSPVESTTKCPDNASQLQCAQNGESCVIVVDAANRRAPPQHDQYSGKSTTLHSDMIVYCNSMDRSESDKLPTRISSAISFQDEETVDESSEAAASSSVFEARHAGGRKLKSTDQRVASRTASRRWTRKRSAGSQKNMKFVCSVCAEPIRNRLLFARHFSTNHRGRTCSQRPNVDFPFTCETCGKYYRSARNFAVHQIAHKEIKPFLCDACGNRFLAQSTLDRHILMQHTSPRSFVCDRCGENFIDRSQMVKHNKTHEPVSRYSGETCNTAVNDLNIDQLLQHSHTYLAGSLLRDKLLTEIVAVSDHDYSNSFHCDSEVCINTESI